jgi:hypothetical protein
LSAAGFASSALSAPFTIEGTIRSFVVNNAAATGTATAGSVKCGELVVTIRGTTIIRTPTRQITFAELVSPTLLPAEGAAGVTGLPRAGFLGGACVITGDTATQAGAYVGDLALIEVAEAFMSGVVTSTAPFAIDNAQVVDSLDSRLTTLKPAAGFYTSTGTHPAGAIGTWPNAFTETVVSNEGFGIDRTTSIIGAAAAARGYWGTDNVMHAFNIVSDGVLTRTELRASIGKAAFLNSGVAGKDAIRLSGGCVLGGALSTTPVKVEYQPSPTAKVPNPAWVSAGANVACAAVVPGVVTPGVNVGRYTFVNTGLNFGGVNPARLRATIDNVKYDFFTF